jgi:hypothetical protein
MAERKAKPAAKPAEPMVTGYTVLECLPANEGENGVKHMNGDDIEGTELWLAIGTGSARTKKAAIDLVVNDRAGVFKAVATSSWKGGEERMEQTRMVGKPLEE